MAGVNFINILQVSFCIKLFCKAFSYYSYWLYNFWQKSIGAKASHKLLVKLTTVVNFINVLRAIFCTNFSPKPKLNKKKLPKKTFVRKIRVYNVDEIDCRSRNTTTRCRYKTTNRFTFRNSTTGRLNRFPAATNRFPLTLRFNRSPSPRSIRTARQPPRQFTKRWNRSTSSPLLSLTGHRFLRTTLSLQRFQHMNHLNRFMSRNKKRMELQSPVQSIPSFRHQIQVWTKARPLLKINFFLRKCNWFQLIKWKMHHICFSC